MRHGATTREGKPINAEWVQRILEEEADALAKRQHAGTIKGRP